MGLCQVCSTQSIYDLLDSAVKNTKLTDQARDHVSLGRWVDLQSRRESCQLCDAVTILLRETITKRLPSNYPVFQRAVEEDVTCGLKRYAPAHIDVSTSIPGGYARIAISVEVQKRTYTGREPIYFQLDDAFQVSVTPPQSYVGAILPASPQGKLQARPATLVRPQIVADPYDPRLIREWLDLCIHDHGDACLSPSVEPISKIRLVDIKKQAIIEFPCSENAQIPPFVALSWVWGSTKARDGLTLNRVPLAAKDNFLDSLQLPPAVHDLLDLVAQIEERFIWVDILGIVQDDELDKQWYIPRMGAIYSGALFTVVANGANGSQDGLPGVRADARPREQVTLDIGGVTLTSCLEPKFTYSSDPQDVAKFREDDFIPPWETRGWTLQEKLLARRCLIMGSRQMYWQCLQASYCEETRYEQLPNPVKKDIISTHEPLDSVFS